MALERIRKSHSRWSIIELAGAYMIAGGVFAAVLSVGDWLKGNM